jgi:hypothetical protein
MTSIAIDPQLLALPPLAIAAGVDLYLTLLLLGAAPTLGLGPDPLPGALSDLDSASVLITVGLFYLLEFTAERFPQSAIVWNAFHAIIRPVSGMLLAILLLDGQPLTVVVGGALVAALMTSAAHGVRSGAAVLRWLGAGLRVPRLLITLVEDAVVIGVVLLTLYAPSRAVIAAGLAAVVVSPLALSLLRAFEYAVLLIVGRIFVTFRQRRWRSFDELPAWASASLEGDDVFAPGGALRGTPAGAYKLPGGPRFAIGWVVIRGGAPVFVFRSRRRTGRIDLGSLQARSIAEADLFRRVDLAGESGRPFLLFGLGGPGAESLRAEFDVPAGPTVTTA